AVNTDKSPTFVFSVYRSVKPPTFSGYPLETELYGLRIRSLCTRVVLSEGIQKTVGDEERRSLKRNPSHCFDMRDTQTTKSRAIWVKSCSHCLIRCTIECTTMTIPNHGEQVFYT
ncbi:hypothetical protein J6590_013860, partial [Homalodisca vitripennis]